MEKGTPVRWWREATGSGWHYGTLVAVSETRATVLSSKGVTKRVPVTDVEPTPPSLLGQKEIKETG